MQKKRVLSLVLSMIVCIVMMPMAVFADNATGGGAEEPVGVWTDEEFVAESFAGGSGIKDDPYKIETAGQLAKLAADINSGVEDKNHSKEYFILTKDIDLSAHKWEPIGYAAGDHAKKFVGYFDGDNKTITGLYVKEERALEDNNYSAGLFGSIGGGMIKNLIIENGYVEAVKKAGILIGDATISYGSNKNIVNCKVSGTVKGTEKQTGGMVGYNSYGSYENCIADVNIIGAGIAGGFIGEDFLGTYKNCEAKGNVSGSWSVGGFAGILFYQSQAEKCASYGKVEATNWNTGGFVGYIEDNVVIQNCASLGDVENPVYWVTPKLGGFAGTNNAGCRIENSHAAGKVTLKADGQTVAYPANGFIGFDCGGTTTDCSFDKIKNDGLEAIGKTDQTNTDNNAVAAETTQKVLSNICIDYYGGHDLPNAFTVDKEATCLVAGSQSKHCTRCDEKCEITAIAATGHNLVKVDAKEATTTEAGNKEHWKCEKCGTLYADENGTTEISEAEVTIPKKSYSGGGSYNPVQKPEISAGEGGKTSLENNGTTLVITPDDGMQISKVTVNGNEVTVTDNKVTGLKTGDKVEVTFTKIPPTKEELDKAFKEKAGEIELVVRTSKTSKNNIKVTVKLTPALEAFIKEIKSAGYTVKYKFYRSANKSSKYAVRITKEEAEYLNTEGKKDKKYYYKAKLLIYDNEGNLVATELKQCKYGLRTWSK